MADVASSTCVEVQPSDGAEPRSTVGAVLVVGGGVSGIQASLDLAGSGFKVYLVEEGPSIGGRMAQLDKTFPTNECSMCILSPKLIDCERNPNIEIITLARVDEVAGEAGNFTVTLVKRPRFVNEEECTGCGTCADYCPLNVADPFNEGLSETKCIHVPFAQAVPAVSVVDAERCLFFTQRQCKICAQTCRRKAIDMRQTEETMEINVGAIILAPGYQPFDAREKPEYGYGRYANVLTGLEVERMLNAAGPSGGEVVRPSDGRPARSIAWIQCVGSRDAALGRPYCSAVCCMYAAKQLTMAREHDPDLEATVFHNDVRTYGKGFEQYYRQVSQMPGVRYIRSMPSSVKEMQQTSNLLIRHWSEDDAAREEEFDLVVLSVGMTPSPNTLELANKLGVEVDEHGFCRTSLFSPVSTSRPGVFVAGVFAGPADIPDSVTRACAAASLSAQILSGVRGSLTTEKEYPPEKDVLGERARIGVFVCRCGTNIGRVVDVPSVVRHARNLPNVVHAEENLFSCSVDSSRRIIEAIEEMGLNRIVVAACTPRTHEPLFQDTIRGAGLNSSLFEMANIREQCSWVHMRWEDIATEKAQDLVDMAVARSRLAQPTRRLLLEISRSALVLGGGVAGMTAALSLAEQGFPVHIVEKSGQMGGVANRLRYSLDGTDVGAEVKALVTRVEGHQLITVHRNATAREVRGHVGNFSSLLALGDGDQERTIDHGVIIVATGARERPPTEYRYGEDERVLTLLELEGQIASGGPLVRGAGNVVFIQCVGSRDDDRPYCSRVCCRQSVKLALKLKEINPDANVHVFYRDLRTYGLSEESYRLARERGVRFLRYEPESPPQVSIDGDTGTLQVAGDDRDQERRVVIAADIVALAGATIPAEDNPAISKLLKVPLTSDGFFLEAHMKLRPVDFTRDGVFVCGLAHGPKALDEAVAQAQAAAARAACVLSQKMLEVPGTVAEVRADMCSGCGLCEAVCPFGAIGIDREAMVAVVNDVLCKTCGACAAACYPGAIDVQGFSNEQILAAIEAV
jgi:heterodisulfide reductase subunit A